MIFIIVAAVGAFLNQSIQFAFDTDSVRATIPTEMSRAKEKINRDAISAARPRQIPFRAIVTLLYYFCQIFALAVASIIAVFHKESCRFT